ncbi:MAG: DUF3325 domain-containing protein [Methylobacteriaceae bacterium]|jgi:hypothetical protein|uniref:DUF3325 domain-containing protein n=1 Tax=Methylorubrum extorquens TaxID=408 RepID=A0AAX3WGR0_METEX|nr:MULTISPECIES: DUF3325 domain-containing protein [Methylobacteriaceae]KQO77365.1 iron transporter [Methylobacterium sp. Leaf90]KQO94264.1 iron transporter [Methylobacterium sp. Leaf92]KQP95799.1 iron transporter [Methylobacterium sp. Leaf119]MBA9068999.1 hypothetical protein [Methylobacterium sp. RAS18]ABY32488.1 putative iron uptake protein [Methylorubrum extorquens PA1]
MTPLVLAVNLSLSFAALAALCLSLNRHHAEVFDRKAERAAVLRLRLFGWGAIALSFFVAGLWEGWAFGPVQWIGALTGAALALVLLLSYRPRYVAPAALAALAASALPLAVLAVAA